MAQPHPPPYPSSNKLCAAAWTARVHASHRARLVSEPAAVDSDAPRSMHVVINKSKKAMMHDEMCERIQRENHRLLTKMKQIQQSPPTEKAGVVPSHAPSTAHVRSLNGSLRRRQLEEVASENVALLSRINQRKSFYEKAEWSKHAEKHQQLLKLLKEKPVPDDPVPIPRFVLQATERRKPHAYMEGNYTRADTLKNATNATNGGGSTRRRERSVISPRRNGSQSARLPQRPSHGHDVSGYSHAPTTYTIYAPRTPHKTGVSKPSNARIHQLNPLPPLPSPSIVVPASSTPSSSSSSVPWFSSQPPYVLHSGSATARNSSNTASTSNAPSSSSSPSAPSSSSTSSAEMKQNGAEVKKKPQLVDVAALRDVGKSLTELALKNHHTPIIHRGRTIAGKYMIFAAHFVPSSAAAATAPKPQEEHKEVPDPSPASPSTPSDSSFGLVKQPSGTSYLSSKAQGGSIRSLSQCSLLIRSHDPITSHACCLQVTWNMLERMNRSTSTNGKITQNGNSNINANNKGNGKNDSTTSLLTAASGQSSLDTSQVESARKALADALIERVEMTEDELRLSIPNDALTITASRWTAK